MASTEDSRPAPRETESAWKLQTSRSGPCVQHKVSTRESAGRNRNSDGSRHHSVPQQAWQSATTASLNTETASGGSFCDILGRSVSKTAPHNGLMPDTTGRRVEMQRPPFESSRKKQRRRKRKDTDATDCNRSSQCGGVSVLAAGASCQSRRNGGRTRSHRWAGAAVPAQQFTASSRRQRVAMDRKEAG